jgi:hypothetical protein
MKTIVYKTYNAIFKFNLSDFQKCLNRYAETHNNKEVSELQNLLSSASLDQINIPERYNYAAYITLDLITDNKGTVLCKLCNKEYQPNELQSISVGHGTSPFSINFKRKKGGITQLFKKQKLPGMFGGKGFICSKGHELLAIQTWMT